MKDKAQIRPARRKGAASTIGDVARHAGVSAMTVSRVINDGPNVRDATRQRVVEAIRELDYAPNLAARSLASAQTLKIGLLYNNPSAAYLSEVLLGGLDQSSKAGAQLVVEKCEADAEAQALDRLLSSGVDGILLPAPLCDSPAILQWLDEAGLPGVAIASSQPDDSLSAIGIDDAAAARAMTLHLLDLGHRRIGFVQGPSDHASAALRRQGWLQALSERDIATDDNLIVQGSYTYHSGLDAADQLLSLDQPPTAIFASNDDMAAAAIAVAHRRGLDVPRDLTVVGFDDTALATTVWPLLTTIRQPVSDMSRQAVSILIDLIRRRTDQPSPAARERLDFTLIQRQSDGPPPVA